MNKVHIRRVVMTRKRPPRMVARPVPEPAPKKKSRG